MTQFSLLISSIECQKGVNNVLIENQKGANSKDCVQY